MKVKCAISCTIYTALGGKKKLLAPKLDNLFKHVGCQKAKFSMLGVDVGSHYFNKNSVHVKNECEYSTTSQPFILDQLHVNVPF
jgi:hypothetical protein